MKFEAMYTVLLSAFHVIYVKISSHDIIPLDGDNLDLRPHSLLCKMVTNVYKKSFPISIYFDWLVCIMIIVLIQRHFL